MGMWHSGELPLWMVDWQFAHNVEVWWRGGVEAGCALELALNTAAGIEVGVVGPGTHGTGWWVGAAG